MTIPMSKIYLPYLLIYVAAKRGLKIERKNILLSSLPSLILDGGYPTQLNYARVDILHFYPDTHRYIHTYAQVWPHLANRFPLYSLFLLSYTVTCLFDRRLRQR